MTLRLRFALALALLGAVCVAVTGIVGYETTASRLSSSVDNSLEQAVVMLMRQLPPPVRVPASLPRPGNAVPPPAPRRPGNPPPPDLLNLVVEQRLNAAGAVVNDSSAIQLPISASDRSIASKGGVNTLSTVVADGDPYRVITVALAPGGAIQLGRDVRENRDLLASLRTDFIVLALIVIVLAAAAGWLIALRMTRSLARLSRAAEDIARSGTLNAPLVIEGRDEIGRLGRSFTTMVSALARSRAQQQQLVEDAAHELRTPLTSLRSNIDLLRRHRDLPLEQQTGILEDLNSELQELSGLVGELVELGTDRVVPGLEEFIRLDEVAAAMVARTSSRSGREVDLEASEWTIEAQPGAFDRVIGNLLDNAVKFSPEHSPVHVFLRPGRLEVRDHGPGIDENERSAIFERFYRSASARSLSGSGLGLSIVKATVERFGGAVFADNHPDGGAVIGFTLPTEP